MGFHEFWFRANCQSGCGESKNEIHLIECGFLPN